MAVKKAVKLEPKFTGRQLILSERFEEYRDVAAAVLDEEKLYNLVEVEDAIDKYLKGKVN